MPPQVRTCRKCEVSFTLMPGKPGNINDCPNCSEEDVPLVMAKVSWEGKHLMLLEITDNRKEAIRFNKAQARSGVGPLSAFSNGPSPDDRESSKSGSGTEGGAIYHSNLKEKRSVKR